LLDEIDFVWDTDEFQWNKNFESLKAYKKEFGDCKVPYPYKTSDGSKLGQWIGWQRRNTKLSPERKKLLDALGFNWGRKKPKNKII
jgi:hypothetical protein